MSEQCALNDPKWRQCCCNCEHHVPTYSHPHIDGKPISHQNGWACTVALTAFGEKRVQSNWPEHSVGCELYTAITAPGKLQVIENDETIGEFGFHEALDRTHIVLCNFDDHVLEHPAIEKTPLLSALAQKCEEALSSLYQAIGAIRHERFCAPERPDKEKASQVKDTNNVMPLKFE